jgi:hypothetical protein
MIVGAGQDQPATDPRLDLAAGRHGARRGRWRPIACVRRPVPGVAEPFDYAPAVTRDRRLRPIAHGLAAAQNAEQDQPELPQDGLRECPRRPNHETTCAGGIEGVVGVPAAKPQVVNFG